MSQALPKPRCEFQVDSNVNDRYEIQVGFSAPEFSFFAELSFAEAELLAEAIRREVIFAKRMNAAKTRDHRKRLIALHQRWQKRHGL
jgi:hypothetical protein